MDDRPNWANLSNGRRLRLNSNNSIISLFWKTVTEKMTLSFPVSFKIIAGNEAQSQGHTPRQNADWGQDSWLRQRKLLSSSLQYLHFRFISGAKVESPFWTNLYRPIRRIRQKFVPTNWARVLRLNIWSILFFHFFVIFDCCEKIKMFYKNTTDHVLLKEHRFYPFIENVHNSIKITYYDK